VRFAIHKFVGLVSVEGDGRSLQSLQSHLLEGRATPIFRDRLFLTARRLVFCVYGSGDFRELREGQANRQELALPDRRAVACV